MNDKIMIYKEDYISLLTEVQMFVEMVLEEGYGRTMARNIKKRVKNIKERTEKLLVKKMEIKTKGKLKISEFDKSFYSDTHDVPIIKIGSQVVEIGDGYTRGWDWNKKEDSLRWKLDPEKEYEVIIRECE